MENTAAENKAKLERIKKLFRADEMSASEMKPVKRSICAENKSAKRVRKVSSENGALPPTPSPSTSSSSASPSNKEETPSAAASLPLHYRLNKYGQQIPLTPPYSYDYDVDVAGEASASAPAAEEIPLTSAVVEDNYYSDISSSSFDWDSDDDDADRLMPPRRWDPFNNDEHQEDHNYTDISLSPLDNSCDWNDDDVESDASDNSSDLVEVSSSADQM